MSDEVSYNTRSNRDGRLYPKANSRVYWVLTQLRQCYEKLIAEYLSDQSDLKIVDYGCGDMPYRSLFTEGYYVAADLPGNELADIVLREDGTLPLADEDCDIVLSSQVLEHVVDVPLYLSEAHRILSTDGLLFLSTHGAWRYHPDPCDYWRWTCDGLKKVVSENGFEVIEFRGILAAEAAALQLWQDARARRLPRRLRPWFYRYTQSKIRRCDSKYTDKQRARDASVFVLVAQAK